jgi:hypothetical protein
MIWKRTCKSTKGSSINISRSRKVSTKGGSIDISRSGRVHQGIGNAHVKVQRVVVLTLHGN